MTVVDPTFDFEMSLFNRGARYVIGCDEVGRGALAGPVAVGMCLVDSQVGDFPAGLRDSKMLSERHRERLAPLSSDWSLFSSVGMASPLEVDELGISRALGLAGKRALTSLHSAGARILDSVVLLDGHFDWLNPALRSPVPVVTRVKGDRDCASVAAASVIAKVHRDGLMIDAHTTSPEYGWASNKGYGSASHREAIARLGPSKIHRLSWLKNTFAADAARSPVAAQ